MTVLRVRWPAVYLLINGRSSQVAFSTTSFSSTHAPTCSFFQDPLCSTHPSTPLFLHSKPTNTSLPPTFVAHTSVIFHACWLLFPLSVSTLNVINFSITIVLLVWEPPTKKNNFLLPNWVRCWGKGWISTRELCVTSLTNHQTSNPTETQVHEGVIQGLHKTLKKWAFSIKGKQKLY